MRRLQGVVSVRNSVKVRPSLSPDNIKHRIEDAFRRIAQVGLPIESVVHTQGTDRHSAGFMRFACGRNTIRQRELHGRHRVSPASRTN